MIFVVVIRSKFEDNSALCYFAVVSGVILSGVHGATSANTCCSDCSVEVV